MHWGRAEFLSLYGRAQHGSKMQGKWLERETGIEPATNGLGSRDSTTELLPLWLRCSGFRLRADVVPLLAPAKRLKSNTAAK
jgi:hypothetical protein